jgi:hypothetical protein
MVDGPGRRRLRGSAALLHRPGARLRRRYSAFEDIEKAAISGHRWWTAAELAATSDVLRPAELPELLASLLMDGPPAQSITVDG